MPDFLWHKCLGQISKNMMKILIKNEIPQNLDFINLNIYVDSIKGKQIKHAKKWTTKIT